VDCCSNSMEVLAHWNLECCRRVQMHIYLYRSTLFVGSMAPQITSDVSQSPSNIWRATSTGKPFRTFRKIGVGRSQLIDICELLSAYRPGGHASQNGIVKAEFHDVCVLSVEICLLTVSTRVAKDLIQLTWSNLSASIITPIPAQVSA
jgi:hypothetical protein